MQEGTRERVEHMQSPLLLSRTSCSPQPTGVWLGVVLHHQFWLLKGQGTVSGTRADPETLCLPHLASLTVTLI